MKSKTLYTLRFFKGDIHSESYERNVTEDLIFIFFSMCNTYYLKKVGKNKFGLVMIFTPVTFIEVREAGYPLYTRLMGIKNFENAYNKTM